MIKELVEEDKKCIPMSLQYLEYKSLRAFTFLELSSEEKHNLALLSFPLYFHYLESISSLEDYIKVIKEERKRAGV